MPLPPLISNLYVLATSRIGLLFSFLPAPSVSVPWSPSPPALGLRSALALVALALGSALVFGAGWLRRRLLALVFVAGVDAVPKSHASSQ